MLDNLQNQTNPQEMDALMGAMMVDATKSDVIVKAEDIELGGGMDFSEIFFDPQVGHTYTLKFINNLDGLGPIVHRKVYKNLPDPKRKGKTFHSVSSGVASTDKVLELFFDLNNLKKAGDALATQKLEKFMGVTNQGACIVQILNSQVKEDIGKYRIFVFSTFGPNATVANLLNMKLNPSAEKIAAGFEKEDVFNLFESPVMLLECTEATYEGRKGRDFTKSEWAPKKRGCFVRMQDPADETKQIEHVFSPADLVDGKVKPEVLPFFQELIKILKNPKISIYQMFAYKAIGDSRNTEDTEKYLKDVQEKVDTIVPIIREAKTIAEIAGSQSTEENDSAKTISGQSAADILKESVPTEITGSTVLNQQEARPQAEVAPADSKNGDVEDILNS